MSVKLRKYSKTAEQAVGLVQSMVSHDLRNPLSIAYGELELYRETTEDTHLDEVENALGRIEDLIVDLTCTCSEFHPQKSISRSLLTAVAEDAWELIDTRAASLETEDDVIIGDRNNSKHFSRICSETQSATAVRTLLSGSPLGDWLLS